LTIQPVFDIWMVIISFVGRLPLITQAQTKISL